MLRIIKKTSKNEFKRLGYYINSWDDFYHLPGVHRINYSEGETIYIDSGEAHLVFENNKILNINSKDLVIIPKGSTLQWNVLEKIIYHYYPSPLKVYKNSEIINGLNEIHNNVPFLPTRYAGYYKLPNKIYKEIKRTNYSQNSIQKAADHICVYLGLIKNIQVKISSSSIEHTLNKPSSPKSVGKSMRNFVKARCLC